MGTGWWWDTDRDARPRLRRRRRRTADPTRRDPRRRLSDDDASDIQPLSVVEGLSYALQWADREASVVELETGELRHFDAQRLGQLASVVESGVGGDD